MRTQRAVTKWKGETKTVVRMFKKMRKGVEERNKRETAYVKVPMT